MSHTNCRNLCKLLKVLDAKIEDQGDKLRLGMLSLQSAIGEGRQGGGGGDPDDDGDFVPLDEVEKIQSEAMEGFRESFTKQITDLEDQVVELKSDIKQQGDVGVKCKFINDLVAFDLDN